jgi:uncharacterized membrane protein
MSLAHSRSTVAVAGHPVHATLASFPIVCFTLTLLADIAFWRTSNLMWQHFAEWLLLAGLVFGALAALAGAVDFLVRPAVRAPRSAWPHAVGSVIVLVLAIVNSFVHAADGWTGVVPYGLILSAVTVLVMMVSDWFGRAMVFRHGVGVTASESRRSEQL